ncbi:hypothetical protein IMX26_06350 [Clostridium sp. 'deep sea']|uniref:hypothetical protein n=1 Tax=Clostridium sp. 'deep sea' TaxID=2779445 RepID=UPI001896A322|nr:hypothetical protein [Clostridium sp. 'deep sea']QOR36427.1 hypothetical protein IMX26_06350 [Clostridium sp. 'deep sea']
MKIKTYIKYQVADSRNSISIYYLIIFTVLVLAFLSKALNFGGIQVNGLELSTAIFMFVGGIATFKDGFKFGLVNGLTRKTIFTGLVLAVFPIAAIMAFVDSIIRVVGSLISGYESIFSSMYLSRYTGNSLLSYLEGFLWMVFLYALINLLGMLISMIYYRSNKRLKQLISFGVPLLFLISIPILDKSVPGGVINRIYKAFAIFFGKYNTSNPLLFVFWSSIAIIVIALFQYLLIRKATVKK